MQYNQLTVPLTTVTGIINELGKLLFKYGLYYFIYLKLCIVLLFTIMYDYLCISLMNMIFEYEEC